MKTRNITRILMLATVIVATQWGTAKQAFAGQFTHDTCTVDAAFDSDTGGTLRNALNLAKIQDANRQQCAKKIIINVPRIVLKQPIIIEPFIGSSSFEITGNDASKPVELNFSTVAISGSVQPMEHCVVTIRNANKVALRNMTVLGSNASGICVGSLANGTPVTETQFDNVHIQRAAGHGFILRESATRTTISPNSSVADVAGDGIKVLNASSQALNALVATNRVPNGMEKNANNEETGFVKLDSPADGAPEQNFNFLGIGSGRIATTKTAAICVNPDNIIKLSDTRYQVFGQIVKAPDDPNSSNDVICSQPRIQGVKRLQVYSLQSDAQGQKGQFLGYIAQRSLTSGGSVGVSDIGSDSGTFRFEIDTTTSGSDMIALVPETFESTQNRAVIGGSSSIIQLKAGNNSGNNNSDSVTPGTPGIVTNFLSQCDPVLAAAGNAHPDPTTDTDGDGIPDRLEDSNGDCIYDATTDLSDWRAVDSDHDGIPDLQELKTGLSSVNILGRGNHRGSGGVAFCGTNPLRDPCDVDHDGKSNLADDDADNDGLPDYQEDGPRFMSNSNKGFYHFYVGSSRPLVTKNGSSIPCDLTDQRSIDVGIQYGLYLIKLLPAGGIDSITPWDFLTRANSTNEQIRVLACQNENVRDENFNGNKESTETNPYSIDTDNDGVCDGDGDGCKDASGAPLPTAQLNDLCPNKYQPDNKCEPDCQDQAVLRNLDSIYKEPRGGLRTVANGEYKLFDDFKNDPNRADIIMNLCNSDIDRDNIPDCVELPTGRCADRKIGKYLDPFKKDSDDDGAYDDIDLNPFRANASGLAGDVYLSDDSGMTDTQRNALRTVFQNSNKYLMLFVDRDGDGLKDGEEDTNLDSQFQKVMGLPGRTTTETDPLRRDTDGDSIDDKTEVKTWNRYTNPADPDTDGDKLPDGFEIRVGSAPQAGDYSDQSGTGCAGVTALNAGNVRMETLLTWSNDTSRNQYHTGTDPSKKDTDGDSIDDGVEVVGTYFSDSDVLAKILDGTLAREGIDMVSNPLAKDSDGDSLSDSQEYGTSGIMDRNSSNPCAKNTDHDGIISDKDEKAGCATNPDPSCLGPSDSGVDKGIDSDNDGLPDVVEDLNQNGRRDPGETDALNPDSDGDHLSDGLEKQLLTDPLKADSDGDCISDEKELGLTDAASLNAAMSTVTIHMANGQTSTAKVVLQRSYSPGANTNPMNPDTDGDGLCDGGNPVPRADGTMICIRGEDLDCNGIINKDSKNPNIMLETDPRNPDTDSDGANDKQEMCAGGTCNLAANLGNATTGRSTGCFSLTGNDPLDPASMLYVFGAMIMTNRMLMWRLRRKKK